MNHNLIIDTSVQWLFKLAYQFKLLYNQLFYPKAYGVYIAVWAEGKILIIKNSYKSYFTLPCGGIKKDEPDKLAAVRELFEEVNIQTNAEDLRFISSFLSFFESMHDHINLYELHLDKTPEFNIDNREVIWGEFIPPEKVLEMDLFPVVRNYLLNKVESAKKLSI